MTITKNMGKAEIMKNVVRKTEMKTAIGKGNCKNIIGKKEVSKNIVSKTENKMAISHGNSNLFHNAFDPDVCIKLLSNRCIWFGLVCWRLPELKVPNLYFMT